MGLAGILEKIGSMFTHKKIGPDEDNLKITHSIQQLLNNGVLNISDGSVMGISLQESNPMENEKLERMAGSFELSQEKKQLFEFILNLINSKNETFLRNIFLEVADYEWGEKSIKQMIGTWPSVINDFVSLGQSLPNETKASVIMKKAGTTKDVSEFLSKKQIIFKRWKDALKEGAKKKLSGKK